MIAKNIFFSIALKFKKGRTLCPTFLVTEKLTYGQLNIKTLGFVPIHYY